MVRIVEQCLKVFNLLFSGVLITGVALITEMCENSPDTLNHFKKVSICQSLIIQVLGFRHD